MFEYVINKTLNFDCHWFVISTFWIPPMFWDTLFNNRLKWPLMAPSFELIYSCNFVKSIFNFLLNKKIDCFQPVNRLSAPDLNVNYVWDFNRLSLNNQEFAFSRLQLNGVLCGYQIHGNLYSQIINSQLNFGIFSKKSGKIW